MLFPRGKVWTQWSRGWEAWRDGRTVIFYCAVRVEASKGGRGFSVPCRVIVVGERQAKGIYLIHPWIMNDLPPGALLDQNTLFICQGIPQKQQYWPQWAHRGRRKPCCSEPSMQRHTFSTILRKIWDEKKYPAVEENKRICFRERWNFPPLKWNKDWPGESFFLLFWDLLMCL